MADSKSSDFCAPDFFNWPAMIISALRKTGILPNPPRLSQFILPHAENLRKIRTHQDSNHPVVAAINRGLHAGGLREQRTAYFHSQFRDIIADGKPFFNPPFTAR
ncbi:MAG: hypothetical protein Q7J38_00135 [Gallionella sp.]|nr:hypothetical protein [Gallionella sp.]